jgi:hypothetical protein
LGLFRQLTDDERQTGKTLVYIGGLLKSLTFNLSLLLFFTSSQINESELGVFQGHQSTIFFLVGKIDFKDRMRPGRGVVGFSFLDCSD